MNKEIQKLLNSDKTSDIEKGLELISKKGTVKELSLVCNLLNQSGIDHLETRIIELISSIKDKNANSIIVDSIIEIKNHKGKLRAILQSCWQSQLDFTQHLMLFTEIFIENDYITALEAFTVIENIWIDHTYEEAHQQLLIDTIKDNLSKMDDSKVVLAKELILVLES